MRNLKKTPKDFGLWIASSPYSHYIPTARNKMRHAEKSLLITHCGVIKCQHYHGKKMKY